MWRNVDDVDVVCALRACQKVIVVMPPACMVNSNQPIRHFQRKTPTMMEFQILWLWATYQLCVSVVYVVAKYRLARFSAYQHRAQEHTVQPATTSWNVYIKKTKCERMKNAYVVVVSNFRSRGLATELSVYTMHCAQHRGPCDKPYRWWLYNIFLCRWYIDSNESMLWYCLILC